MRKPTQFETLRCAAGHTWQAPLRDAVLGDCTTYGAKLVCEGHETCPDCGLLPGVQEYCFVCDEPLSQERIGEIAAAADHPEALGPRDFICAAHAEAVAGDDCRPMESAVIDIFPRARALADLLNPRPQRAVS